MISNELITQYIAEDGGCRLDLNDRAILDGQATTANQNGNLFLAYLDRALIDNPLTKEAILKHEAIVKVGKGRYLRRKGEPLRQSHDNVLAWCYFSVKYPELAFVADDIYKWARLRLFVYDPNKSFSLDPRCLLQGSQVFFLKLAANRKPGWLSTIWACGAALVQDHASGPYLLSMLESDIISARWSLLSPLKQRLINYAIGMMEKRREKMARWYGEYFNDQNHPAIAAAKENNL